jgi:hypothetical protein
MGKKEGGAIGFNGVISGKRSSSFRRRRCQSPTPCRKLGRFLDTGTQDLQGLEEEFGALLFEQERVRANIPPTRQGQIIRRQSHLIPIME